MDFNLVFMGVMAVTAVLWTVLATVDRRRLKRAMRGLEEWSKKGGFEFVQNPYGVYGPGDDPKVHPMARFEARLSQTEHVRGALRRWLAARSAGVVDGIFVEICFLSSESRGQRGTLQFFQTIVMASVPVSLPKLRIRPTRLKNKIAENFGGRDYQVGVSAFDEALHLVTTDEGRCEKLLNEEMRNFLLGRPKRDWQVEHQLIVLVTPQHSPPENLQPMVDDVVGFAKRIPEQYHRDHPAPLN